MFVLNLFCLIGCVLSSPCSDRESVRVACLGDSITVGATLADAERLCYPAQLAAHLAGTHEVRAFAEGGRTLLQDADLPYQRCESFARALDWRPELAVVVLGTNDTCQDERRSNWDHQNFLERDANALVDRLKAANASIRILLCSPPPMFPDAADLQPDRIANLRERAPRTARIRSALRNVAAKRDGVEYHDLQRVIRIEQVTDGVHPNASGAAAIADRIAAIVTTAFEERSPITARLDGIQTAATPGEAFFEYQSLELALDPEGAAAKVVVPEVVAPGRPWIWRARFFGHRPELDLALLDRGYHLAYCDVADLYGAPVARERWTRFHALLLRCGLSSKPVLEGMSRGGLPVFHWAIEHPDEVAAVIGDNPVLDFRSWPGGRNGKRSEADWEKCKRAYGIDESQAWSYADGPLEHLEALAAARVPVLLVVGTADDVVPPDENAERAAARLRELGGVVEIWRKPGLGHHPHGLDPVDPLLRAVLHRKGHLGDR